ncbi:MAG: hypothetical protein H0S80_11285 [Desulfovibrionaceae bacterium]|nr:hypothetical protein [Desulfovibrionaceae bacterium]
MSRSVEPTFHTRGVDRDEAAAVFERARLGFRPMLTAMMAAEDPKKSARDGYIRP